MEITFEQLQKRPLSASSLKAFGGEQGSPKKYLEYLQKPFADTEAFILGRATELLIYAAIAPEQFKFTDDFEVYQKFEKRSNAAKEKWAGMIEKAQTNNITLIDEIAFKEANILADTALQTHETRYYLDRIATDKDGRKIIQKKIFWTDKKTGLPINGYIDFLVDIEGHLIIVDIKTDKDGTPNKFIRNASNNDYIIQVGAYLTGYHKAYYLFPDFMFLVIGKQLPYDAIMMHCDPEYCDRAKKEFDHILTSFRHCMDTHQFNKGYAFWSSGNGYYTFPFNRYAKLKSSEE